MNSGMNFFLNNPVFVHYKKRFSLSQWAAVSRLKSVVINERIVEIPFAINSLSGLGRRAKALDVGCMESILPLYLAGLGYEVTGVDLREYPYGFPNFTFCQADIMRLPFAERSFDAVTCISTLEHIGLDYYEGSQKQDRADAAAVRELGRVLKSDGILVLTVPFGFYHVDSQQRTYDVSVLAQLLKDFRIEDQRFFKNMKPAGSRNNAWQEIAREEAAAANSSSPSMVCLVKARPCK